MNKRQKGSLLVILLVIIGLVLICYHSITYNSKIRLNPDSGAINRENVQTEATTHVNTQQEAEKGIADFKTRMSGIQLKEHEGITYNPQFGGPVNEDIGIGWPGGDGPTVEETVHAVLKIRLSASSEEYYVTAINTTYGELPGYEFYVKNNSKDQDDEIGNPSYVLRGRMYYTKPIIPGDGFIYGYTDLDESYKPLSYTVLRIYGPDINGLIKETNAPAR
jgi:hypothetical protein